MYWNYIVLIICVLLAVFAIWKEYSRANRLRLGWRIIAVLLAIIALAAIALPVSYPGKNSLAVKNEAVLLTPGLDRDSLNTYKNDSLFTTDAAVQKEYPRAKLITADELKGIMPRIGRIHVLGYGLAESQLKQLDSLPAVFYPAPAPSGVAAVSWTENLKQGQPFNVQGKFSNISTGAIRLVLKGLSTTEDSVVAPAQTTTPFELKFIPKNMGRAVYRLVAITGKDTLANEKLPVNIDPAKPLKLLILSASPGFEDRFLKNWLSENGFSVTARATISKEKFSSDFVNMPKTPLDHLSPSLLDKFDVVVGDLSALKALNTAEAGALKQQVTQKGLGLIINADTTSKTSSWLQENFPTQRLLTKDQKPLSLVIQEKKTAPITFTNEQLGIIYKDGTQTLVSDEQNREMAGTAIAGAGKLVYTTLNNTYTWALAGNKSDYTALWSLLISKAAKAVPQAETWQTVSTVPTINQPISLTVETGTAQGKIAIDSTTLAPTQNAAIPFQWTGTWWPKEPGWHAVKKADGTQAFVFIYKQNDWKTLTALKTIADTRQYAINNAPANDVTKQIHQKESIPVSKIYFYILLLAACIFLWLEAKLAS